MLPAGTRLGRYELIRRFATGGMAELYLARAGGLGALGGFEKIVALKRILPQYAAQEDFVRMFLDEARLTATIQHANVAQVYDIGQCDDGLFFTMEYVHGVDLRTVLHTLARRAQTMLMADALTIAIGAAAGLHAAHERTAHDGSPLGIIHRDVTPSNVLVSFDGCVKLIDFGIAKAERSTTETRAGTLKGKIAYMSPEQCLGEPIDRRSDVFSLGIVLFELSTGTRLYPGDNEYAALRQIVDQDAPLPSSRRADYPPELEAIVMRALRRNPAERYQSAQELQVDLEELARTGGLATSTAHLGGFMRTLLPERATEPLLDDPLRLPLPPPLPQVCPSGTGESPAIPGLADELEPSISIAASDPDLSAASAVSAVSAELALLRRQRSSHLFIAVGAAALISAVVAVLVVLTVVNKPTPRAEPAALSPPAPAHGPPALSPPVISPPAPSPPVIRPPAISPPVPALSPPPATTKPRVKPPSSAKLTKPARPARPAKPAPSSRRWNPDSALPPM
jgi:serine/threonine protein kinase